MYIYLSVLTTKQCKTVPQFHFQFLTSLTAKLDLGHPTILNGYMPADVIGVRPMEQVAFSVAAAGRNIRYKWKKAYGELPEGSEGGDSKTLVIPRVSVGDAGMYQCEVMNEDASVTSNFARLAIGMCNIPCYFPCLQH